MPRNPLCCVFRFRALARPLAASMLGLMLWQTPTTKAGHTAFNNPGDADTVVQEIRWPYWPKDAYDTWWSQRWHSSDGVGGYFYVGLASPYSGRVNWSHWGLSKPIHPDDVDTPAYTGPTCKYKLNTVEGTMCGAGAYFPIWKTNVWYQSVLRIWKPLDGTPHKSYVGLWLRDGATSIWYHHGTLQLPFAVTGFGAAEGFMERGTSRVEHRNCYYHKDGVWNSANQFKLLSRNHQKTLGRAGVIENGTALFVEEGKDITDNGYKLGTWLTMGNQPAKPTFDPIRVTNCAAARVGKQLVVQWQMPPTSAPQFAYRIDVYDNASHRGKPVATVYENEAEVRQKMLTLPRGITPYPQLTIMDVFCQTNTPIALAVSNASLNAAKSVSGLVNGLNYAYYQSATNYTSYETEHRHGANSEGFVNKRNWTSLPDFAKMKPVASGAVSGLDLTPRQRRYGYAFNYAGYIQVPSDGLYAFMLNSSDGSALYVDGQLVVNWDGIHSTSDKAGWIGLQAGYHALNVRYFFDTIYVPDGLTLFYEGPGIARTVVPVSAFYRVPGVGEPSVRLTSPDNGEPVCNAAVPMSATVTANGNKINSVQFYVGDSYLTQVRTPPYSINTLMWASPSNALRSRVIYNGNKSVDSAVRVVTTTNQTISPWKCDQIFVHRHPNGAQIQNGVYSLIGDGVNMLSRQVSGDCTIIAHLAGLPSATAAMPDGTTADDTWQAGIILRGGTNLTMGYPLGCDPHAQEAKSSCPFAAVFGDVGGRAYYQDETMHSGRGAEKSKSLGGQKWFKLVRSHLTNYTSYVSTDGKTWKQVHSVTLPEFGATTIYAGLFTYAMPTDENDNVHWARFDHVILTGPHVRR